VNAFKIPPAPDAWAGRIEALLFIQFTVNNNGGSSSVRAPMVQYYDVARIELCGRKSLHFFGRSFVHPFRYAVFA